MKKKKLSDSTLSEIYSKKDKLVENILAWGRNNYRDFPWRSSRTPYSVLACEILLRRTTAQAVNNIFDSFLETYPDIQSLHKADISQLEEFLSKIGYQKQRSIIFKDIAWYLIDNHKGKVPSTQDELLAIPQVGHYITNSVLTFGFGEPTSIVDTNVERILKRVFTELKVLKTLRLIREVADILAPESSNQQYNYALLDLGGLICKHKNPYCERCPITAICESGV